jgi:cyanophycinase-like exopeptidase
MTKFILHGGMTSVGNENNRNFYEEIIKDSPKNPKILISLFATEEDRWNEEYGYQKNNFIENLGDLGFNFKLADKENFLEQIKWADIIHFRGGDTLKLLDLIKRYPDFRKKIKNKTVSGSSAGALILVDKFYDQDHQEIFKGLGIINISLITHHNSATYGKDPREILDKLKNGKELVLLKETEFKVFKINL